MIFNIYIRYSASSFRFYKKWLEDRSRKSYVPSYLMSNKGSGGLAFTGINADIHFLYLPHYKKVGDA